MKTKEYMREYSAKSRKKHPKKNRAYQKKWRDANRESANGMYRAWAKKNKKRIKANNAARYKRDKVRITKRNAAYRKAHPEAANARTHKRRAAKTKAGGAYTSEQWMTLCNKFGNVCLCCRKSKKLTPDHVIPIAKGGTSNISNIQPLCMPCNAHKHTGTTDFRSSF
jgi:5-methylcytosine-specific restriction endonuclease McrA